MSKVSPDFQTQFYATLTQAVQAMVEKLRWLDTWEDYAKKTVLQCAFCKASVREGHENFDKALRIKDNGIQNIADFPHFWDCPLQAVVVKLEENEADKKKLVQWNILPQDVWLSYVPNANALQCRLCMGYCFESHADFHRILRLVHDGTMTADVFPHASHCPFYSAKG